MSVVRVDLTDGRYCEVRDLDAGDMLDLIEVAGESAVSDTWMRYAMTICAVRSIDGVPVVMPRNKDALKELARRVGIDGLSIIADILSDAAISDRESLTAKN